MGARTLLLSQLLLLYIWPATPASFLPPGWATAPVEPSQAFCPSLPKWRLSLPTVCQSCPLGRTSLIAGLHLFMLQEACPWWRVECETLRVLFPDGPDRKLSSGEAYPLAQGQGKGQARAQVWLLLGNFAAPTCTCRLFFDSLFGGREERVWRWQPTLYRDLILDSSAPGAGKECLFFSWKYLVMDWIVSPPQKTGWSPNPQYLRMPPDWK